MTASRPSSEARWAALARRYLAGKSKLDPDMIRELRMRGLIPPERGRSAPAFRHQGRR